MPILLKAHLFFGLISIIGLIARILLKWKGSSLLNHKLIKILPHVNDTLLLCMGVSLAFTLGVNPVSQPWLAAKIVGILCYILLGIYALKIARSNLQMLMGTVAAVVCFFWIASVGFTNSPQGFFG